MKINGNLEFHTLGAGEIKNAIIERIAGGAGGGTLPGVNVAGQLAYNTDENIYYFNDGSGWVSLATGGNAAGLQQEVDAIETASGGIFDVDGTYVAATLDAANNITGSTNLADAILQLDSAIEGIDTLAELGDTDISGPASGQVLIYDGTNSWDNATPTLANMAPDVSASAAEVSYMAGVTSAVQTQINDLGTEDGYIRAFIGKTGSGSETPTYSTTNYLVQGDTLEVAIGKLDAALSTGLSSISLDDLSDVADSFSGATTTGNTYALKGNAAGDGYDVDALTFGDLNNVASGVDSAGTEDILAFDGTQWTAITPATFGADIDLGNLGDVQDATGYTAGELFGLVGNAGTSYDVTQVNLGTITNVTDSGVSGHIMYADSSTTWATAAPGATTGVQAYDLNLDEIAALTPADSTFIVGDGSSWVAESGATVRASLDVMSTADLASTYVAVTGDTMSGTLNMGSQTISNVAAPSAGTDAANKSYVDGFLAGMSWKNPVVAASTANIDLATGGLLTIDGVGPLTAGDRVLVKDQTLPAENGIYVVAAGAWSRSTDMDELSPIDEVNGAAVFVLSGTANADIGYNMNSTVTTLGTDAQTWVPFTGTSAIVDGIGLVLTGNVLDVNLGAGISAFPSDFVGVDIYGYDGGSSALGFTNNGTTRIATEAAVAAGDELHLFIDGSTLSQSAAGIKVAAGGITETEISASVAGAGLAGGSGTVLSVNVDDSTIEITSDTLNVKDAGITNAKLANSTFSTAGTSGTGSVALGGTLSILGGTGITTVDNTSGTITVSGVDATTATKGIASFAAADFDVTSGAVSIKAGSIANGDLANSEITMAADSGSADPVALGETFTITGGTLATTTVSANTVTIDVAADSADLGDVTAAATAAGQMLVSDGTNYTPRQIQYVSTEASATTWTVVHNLGQKFVNVTVYDSADQVIIPGSITATDANTTTITFNTAIAGTAVIMGVQGV